MNDLVRFLTNLNINRSEQERFDAHPMLMHGAPSAVDGLRIEELTAVMGTCCFTDPGPDPDPDPEPPPSDET